MSQPPSPAATTSPVSIILDIETLHVSPFAVVTDIGIVAFDRKTFEPVDETLIRPGFWPQVEEGRMIDPGTIAYHRKHSTLPDCVTDDHPVVAMKTLSLFLDKHKPECIWIQGPDFDRPILESLFQQFGGELPWEYWRVRDSRTAWNLAFPGVKHDPRPHRALDDCKHTLADLKRSLVALKGEEAHTAA